MHDQIEGVRMSEKPEQRDATAHPRILLVDDDDTIRHMLAYGLKAAGFEVQACANGLQGMSALDSFTPDVIVLDLYMPEMDGLAFLQNYTGAAPIIVCSGSDEEHDIQRTLDKGAARFLQKPVALSVLREAIEAALG